MMEHRVQLKFSEKQKMLNGVFKIYWFGGEAANWNLGRQPQSGTIVDLRDTGKM